MSALLAPASPLPARTLRLADVPPTRRFSQWQEWMDDMIDVLPPRQWPQRAYDGRLDLHAVGDATLSRCRSDAMRLRRTLTRISRDQPRGHVFQFFLAGDPGVVRIGGRETTVRRGDILALDFDQPVEMERPAYEAVGLFVPRYLLAPLLLDADVHGRVAGTREGAGALVAAWLAQYLRQLPQLTSAQARSALEAMLPLLCGCLTDGGADAAATAGVGRAGLLRQLLAAIDRHHGDPEFTPETLRGQFGLSRRQLYAAFAACEHGPATLIRRRRLAAACAELVQQPATPIAQVAYGCGFASPSDFGRAFRREYGLSPGELRASAADAGARRRGAGPVQAYGRYLWPRG